MQRMVRTTRIALASMVIVAGCGSDNAAAPIASDPSFNMSVYDIGATIARGASKATGIVISRSSVSSRAIVLSADSVPTGVVVTFLPKRLEAGQSVSVATISVDESAPPGTRTFVLRATDEQQSGVSKQFALDITPPSIVLSAAAGNVTAIRGGVTASTSLAVTRESGAIGPVTFSIDSAPSDLNVVIGQTVLNDRATANSINVTASSNTSVGIKSIRVRAAMPGVGSSVVTIPVSVIAPGDRGFELRAPQPHITVAAGDTLDIPIGVERFGDFVGGVTLTVGASGFGTVSAAVGNSAASPQSTLKLAAPISAPPGDYTIHIIGNSSGQTERSVPVRVTVQPGITLSYGNITLPMGSVGSTTIRVQRSPTVAPSVSLSVVKAPAFITAAFNPSTISGDVTNLILTAAHTAPPGTYSIEISVSGQGVSARPRLVSVVIPPGS